MSTGYGSDEDIGPNEIADGNIMMASDRRCHTGYKLRKRCTECDDSQTYNALTQADLRADKHSPLQGHFCPHSQSN